MLKNWFIKSGVLFVLPLVPSILWATIDLAEYFFNDTDPGPGQNTLINVTVADGIASATAEDISTSGLGSGIHHVYVRFHDDVYGWGAERGISFLITSETVDYTITEAEYFIDSDPGVGSGTELIVTVNGNTASVNQAITLSGEDEGIHTLYVRFYSPQTGWGAIQGYLFMIPQEEITHRISAAEYFIDDDPGPGSGTNIDIDAAGQVVNITGDIGFENLSPGYHKLALRLFSPESGWGSPQSTFFFVSEEQEIEFIQAAQYFVGSDPESAEIVDIDSPEDGAYDELIESVSLADVTIPDGATGVQNVGVRFQSSSGMWGPWRLSSVSIVEETDVLTIVAAEYFIDVDPGPGSGISIDAPADGTFDEMEEEFDFPVSVDGLDLGQHIVYLRLKSSDGRWGSPQGSLFRTSEDAQPTIAGAEYFTNPATPEGGGIPFTPLDGAFNTLEEDVSALANMASLNTQTPGNYTIYVRFMNSRGEWGPMSSSPFTVEVRPQITTSIDTLDFGYLFTGETRSLNFTISNIGDADLVVDSLEFSDPAYTSDWISGILTPLGAESVNITFAPRILRQIILLQSPSITMMLTKSSFSEVWGLILPPL